MICIEILFDGKKTNYYIYGPRLKQKAAYAVGYGWKSDHRKFPTKNALLGRLESIICMHRKLDEKKCFEYYILSKLGEAAI